MSARRADRTPRVVRARDRGGLRRRRSSWFAVVRTRAIWLFSIALIGASVALVLGALRNVAPAPGASLDVPWWSFALVFYVAETYVVHLHFRREAHTMSLTELVFVPAFYVLSPLGAILAQIVGTGAAFALKRRQRPVKLVFNLAQYAFTTSVAVLVFRKLSSFGDPFGPVGWAAAAAAMLIVCLLGIVLVTAVIAVAEGEWPTRHLAATSTTAVAATLATTSLSLMAVEVARLDVQAFVLLIVPGAIVVVGFRALMNERRRRDHLAFLYESMQKTQGAAEFGLAVGQLLVAARRLVRADYAEIYLFPNDAAQGLRSTVSASGEMLMQPHDVTPADQFALAYAVKSERVVLLPRSRLEHPLDAYLRERGLPDAMIAVLRRDEGPFGLLIVGQRSGDVDTFRPEDAGLIETFAGHASVLIENGRLERSLAEVTKLKEQLSHQAYHDTLTGLPNRASFSERVEGALAQVDLDGQAAAVLFLDLDDFKAINDSMGHAVGDQLLVEVAERLRSCLRPTDVPARLGGDEFAVLLERTSLEHAEGAAARVLETFAKPFSLGGRDTYVHASVGIAPADSALSADELLRNADVAMYAAKDAGKRRFEHYAPSMHALVRKRHEFALDLEHAVDRGEIRVVFQPIVSLRTGEIVLFEALARWHHPQHGIISPVEFVPVAEATGTMRQIGRHIMLEACRAARTWQDARPDYAAAGVSVNLSPAEFATDELVDDVAAALAGSGLAPQSLTLELTESAAMDDVEQVCTRMRELRALGVRLALDDFGTGHSSLERLDALPLNVLKIAKPFVDKLMGATADASFVEAFVRLASSLKLEVVAEGVETEIQATRLREYGYDLGQGYHFAVPLPLDELIGAQRPVRAAA